MILSKNDLNLVSLISLNFYTSYKMIKYLLMNIDHYVAILFVVE